MLMKPEKNLVVAFTREYRHPPERVFDAWVSKEHLMRWMGPTPEINLSYADIDAREGGSYRMGFQMPDGSVDVVHGIYKSMKRPKLLVFTWIWEDPLPDAGVETWVTVKFMPSPEGTIVDLTHEKFADRTMCDRHIEGWRGTLDKLDGLFAS